MPTESLIESFLAELGNRTTALAITTIDASKITEPASTIRLVIRIRRSKIRLQLYRIGDRITDIVTTENITPGEIFLVQQIVYTR